MPKKIARPQRKPNPVLHIFCEGENTEPIYFEKYIDTFCPGNRRIQVIRVEKTDKNTPVQLVDVADELKKQSPPGDLFWVVYDRESEQKYSGTLHAQAADKARANSIFIALSNVCFEVWLLLHFQKKCAAYSNCKDLEKRSTLKTKECLPGYEKSTDNWSRLRDRVATARQNARFINKCTQDAADSRWTRPDQWNPYTNVYELLDAIDAFEKK